MSGERKSLWIPRTIVAGFVVVTGVNAIMIWFALTTFTGLDREEPYLRGVAYNQVLAEEREQAALGWAASIRAEHETLAVEVRDRLAQPVRGAAVSARLKRPVDAALDFETELVQAGAGSYVAPVRWPAAGQWDVLVTIELDGHRYQHKERVLVR